MIEMGEIVGRYWRFDNGANDTLDMFVSVTVKIHAYIVHIPQAFVAADFRPNAQHGKPTSKVMKTYDEWPTRNRVSDDWQGQRDMRSPSCGALNKGSRVGEVGYAVEIYNMANETLVRGLQ